MFGYARTSGLPISIQLETAEHQAVCHQIARDQNKANAERMKQQYDEHMMARACKIRVGDKVLFKRDVTRKDISPWDLNPFTVTLVKGSLVTAGRHYPTKQYITRNSSYFKLYMGLEAEEIALADKSQASPDNWGATNAH